VCVIRTNVPSVKTLDDRISYIADLATIGSACKSACVGDKCKKEIKESVIRAMERKYYIDYSTLNFSGPFPLVMW
jgi:hypothetical protein